MNLAPDLDGLFSDILADLAVPTLPTIGEGCGNEQTIERTGISHTSHVSHPENEGLKIFDLNGSDLQDFMPDGSRATSSYVEKMGSVGNVGNQPKTPAEPNGCDFPPSSPLVGKGKEEWELQGLPVESPQSRRSDWWTGPAMVEADRLGPPAGDPLPITPVDVRAGVARELRHLADLGVTGPEVERRAVAITRAKVGNSPALAIKQTNTGRCAVCDGPLGEAEAAIAVLNPGAAPLHLHAGCHGAHRARKVALIDRIMVAAGYGAETTGEAA